MKRSKYILLAVILLSFAASYALKKALSGNPGTDPSARTDDGNLLSPSYRRIVSLAPSVTEVLFALGLDDRVVGVTRYCNYPQEARTKDRVGGYYDPNYEAILSLDPDLVVILPEHADVRAKLQKLGLRTLIVDHRNVSGILNSIPVIGAAGGAQVKARALVLDLESRMKEIKERTTGTRPARVLVSIGREVKDGVVSRVTISGPGTYYDDLIRRAGGQNAYTGAVKYPRVSAESLLSMNPDVIVDLVSDMSERMRNEKDLRREWAAVPGLSAVRNRRVYVLGGDHLTVPGPRFILLLEELARAIYPAIDGKKK